MRALLRRNDDWEKEIDLDLANDFEEVVVPSTLSYIVFRRTDETKHDLPVFVQVREHMKRH